MMNAGNVAGGSLGVILGAVLAALLRKYTAYNPSDQDAAVIGAAMAAAGVALGHGIHKFGLAGVARMIWRGAPPPSEVPVVVVPAPLPPQEVPQP